MKDIKILYIKEILSGKIGNGWALESIYTSGNTKIGENYSYVSMIDKIDKLLGNDKRPWDTVVKK